MLLVETDMKLRKNTAAKLVSLLASLMALGGTWVLVRQNPPAAAGTTTSPTVIPRNAMPSDVARPQPTPTIARSAANAKSHTRTRVS
jgi:hypothetical protein